MASNAKPTPEEIGAARALVATADAEADQARRAEVIATLKPLTDLGLGGDAKFKATPAELTAALRASAGALAAVDPNLPNLTLSTAQVLDTLNDRIRSLVALNSSAASSSEA